MKTVLVWVVWILVYIVVCAILIFYAVPTGCASQNKADLPVTVTTPVLSPTITTTAPVLSPAATGGGTTTTQGPGGWNISPEIIVSGGGAVAVAVLLLVAFLAAAVFRSRKIIGAMIDGIERVGDRATKRAIEGIAEWDGVEKALHRLVQQRTGKTKPKVN